MPCMTQPDLTVQRKLDMQNAIARLDQMLDAGIVKVVVGATGAIAFKGLWRSNGVSDLCAYRALIASNSPALRRAVMRAEALAGRGVNVQAITAGTHSHDGGATWHAGH